MRAKHLSVPFAVAALALAAVPVAPAVTLPNGLLAALRSPATTTAVSAKSKQRSCQAGDKRSQIKLAGPEPVRETERRSATVACEQPPKGNLSLNGGLKGAEASALAAAG
jgi:hypothetical protein